MTHLSVESEELTVASASKRRDRVAAAGAAAHLQPLGAVMDLPGRACFGRSRGSRFGSSNSRVSEVKMTQKRHSKGTAKASAQ